MTIPAGITSSIPSAYTKGMRASGLDHDTVLIVARKQDTGSDSYYFVVANADETAGKHIEIPRHIAGVLADFLSDRLPTD